MLTKPAVLTDRFQLDITRDRVGDFIEVPVKVSGELEELAVVISVEARGASADAGRWAIDLGLAGPGGLVGWSGGARSSFFVRAEAATPGYVPEPIVAGRWAVALGLYEVPRDGCRIVGEVHRTPRLARWRSGDPHAHSFHSDGTHGVREIVALAVARGLEYVAISDHNTTRQHFAGPPDLPITLVPAVEWTSYRGHAGLLGHKGQAPEFRVHDRSEVDDVLAEVRRRGSLVVLNHPFDESGPSCRWGWPTDFPFDGIEVWNGCWNSENERALRLWHERLKCGERLSGIGGSDYHRDGDDRALGSPTTWALADGCTSGDLLRAVRAGRIVLSRGPAGPIMEMRCGEHGIGESASRRVLIAQGVTVRAQGTAGNRLLLVSNIGVVLDEPVPDGVWDRTWRPDRDTSDRLTFLRAELRRTSSIPHAGGADVSAVSNPIFFS